RCARPLGIPVPQRAHFYRLDLRSARLISAALFGADHGIGGTRRLHANGAAKSREQGVRGYNDKRVFDRPTAKKGGAFLLENVAPEAAFTPEDLTPEHRAIAKTTDEFWTRDIAPHLDAIHDQQHAVAAGILKKSAAAGLLGVVIPE